ncbi:uncharacterized protein LOC125212526 isoform X2 [Salvia hispanica]|uniref:uncharacterized protein LOC125212526 isoform X2 n=1 Tax=Salvia hispanica TaxID=49212 RepID=UPI002009C209|nr:uncharacterized protein LOC125212526 isoform X2 [Salvia hispanica]XP_047968682.1 uncharacterized protein LOC125212526 isoform X2 [Salvia hispanica]XP_047968683.1 uncharacterized protein LOC125212526 isoform X2 [Salvia hispanica]
MPFNSVLLISTATRSAEVWQQLACLPERISSDEMVDLVVCFPLQQLGRWALYVWTYLCVSPYPHRHHYEASYTSDDDSDYDDADAAGPSSSGNHDYHYCLYCNNQNTAEISYVMLFLSAGQRVCLERAGNDRC